MRRTLWFVGTAALLSGPVTAARGDEGPRPADLIRISEARRLVATVGAEVWPRWECPFPVLLVGTEREFLISIDAVPEGFTPSGYSALLGEEVWDRPRQFAPNLLATFPAFSGTATVVIGSPEATAKESTSWVLTLCHEHFHQLQMGSPGYFAKVEELDLTDGDQTGTWMLNYPFPYDNEEIGRAFASVSKSLADLLVTSTSSGRARFWNKYQAFLAELPERDERYLSFQIWQEGVARYVELRLAERAGSQYVPSIEFAGLEEGSPFSVEAAALREGILGQLAAPDLASLQRGSFYTLGAGLALLLDVDGDDWKMQYFKRDLRIGPRPTTRQ